MEEWNGDKVVADGAALSALEDDYREWGVLYNRVCPTVKWEKLIALAGSSITSFCLVPFIYSSLVLFFQFKSFAFQDQNRERTLNSHCCHVGIIASLFMI